MSIYSKEHELFLKKIKRKRCLIYVNQILIICLLFTLWEVLSRLNIINSFLFSSPSNIIKTISNLIKENNFFIHVFPPLYLVLHFIMCKKYTIIHNFSFSKNHFIYQQYILFFFLFLLQRILVKVQ